MPRSYGQKLKPLYILEILKSNTDEDHGITMLQLIEKLKAYGITAERKSIYDDIALLRDHFNADIYCDGKSYRLLSGKFELPELKLLVDAVQASKFITSKKSAQLIKKLESLTSVHGARMLQGQVYVRGRIKAMNETIYYNVDLLNEAIAQNRNISFHYFEWTASKEKRLRRNGHLYIAEPCALSWDDENYYLIAFDLDDKIIKHYRVDKMLDISKLENSCGHICDFDAAEYTKRIFGMFGGREETVSFCAENRLAGAVIDRMGQDIMTVPHGEYFTFNAPVRISPQFFGWLTGLGGGITVLAPQYVKDEYLSYLSEIESKYKYGDKS